MPSSVPSVGAASDWLRPIHCGNSLLPQKLPARNLASSGQAPPGGTPSSKNNSMTPIGPPHFQEYKHTT